MFKTDIYANEILVIFLCLLILATKNSELLPENIAG